MVMAADYFSVNKINASVSSHIIHLTLQLQNYIEE